MDDDGLLDEQEWNEGSRDYGLEGQNWTDWDANKDNKLEKEKVRAGLSGNNFYSFCDSGGDKMVNEREYSGGIFGIWDNDRDGGLTYDEYNTRKTRYYGED